MVKKSLLFCLLCFTSLLFSGGVQIEVDVDGKLASENEPLVGKIMILHPQNEMIDEKSFTLEDKPLNVQLLSQGKQSSMTIVNGKRKEEKNCISCYAFQIEGKKKGQHKLPAISIKIGDKFYRSSSSWYEVIGCESHQDFSLEAYVDAPKKIYPGQRFRASYRLYLKADIEPTAEHFPLLSPQGCVKIGERQMRQMRRGNLQIIEFTQLLEAKEVGERAIEAGFVEGFAYQEDFFFRRVYKKPKLRAEAKPQKITVDPFPEDFKLDSFSGAVGKVSMNVELLSPPEVCLGDKMRLKVCFKGGDLETLKLPNFASQKSFKEAFRFSDLPPLGKPEPGIKEFIVEIRPMDPAIKEIPPFEFTYFDPETEQYQLLKSQSIPISVRRLEKPALKISSPLGQNEEEAARPSVDPEGTSAPPLFKAPPPIEIAGLMRLQDREIKNFNSSNQLLLWPWVLGLSLVLIQWLIKKKIWIKRKTNSEKIFLEARNYSREPQKYLLLIEKAFLTRLIEEGWLQREETLERLSEEGLNGEIKTFIDDLYHQLFSGHAHFEFEKSWKRAKYLFKRIGEAR